MDTYVFLVIGLALGTGLGFLIGSRGKNSDGISQGLLQSEQARAERAEAELAQIRETARLQAEQDSRLMTEISPLKQKLTEMQAKVVELEKERTEQFTTITEQIRNQQAIDSQLRNTTAVLANALTNNQTRGGWGETRLEDIVVSAGLVKGVHYETQYETVNHDDVKIRPDMVIMLPDAKFVAIDSKAPMASYLRAQEEREKGIDANKDVIKQYMKQHITDVKKHIQDLAKKDYWSGLENSPEFTLLFIPSEPVLASTLDEENLMEYAFQNRVALVSPVSLFAVLKTVAYTWRQNSDEKVIHDIINLGTALYREVRIIGEKYNKLGGHIDAVVDDYNKLLSNLDKSFLKPARDLNSAAQNRLGIEVVPDPKVIENGTKRASSQELTEGSAVTDNE